MAPFVRLTFDEELNKATEILGLPEPPKHDPFKDYVVTDLSVWPTTEERVIAYAINQTVFRVRQAMESFVHNLNTMHSRGGNQVVFSSINYGTDTSAEGRCVIRELLNVTYRGVGDNKTAIFPIQIWKSKSGVSYLPDDPNYDLYKLACKVSAKRFFPNFLNLDASFNYSPDWDINDPKRYEHEVATMGCLRKGTKVIMADATLREVQDVKVGEWLMGTEGPVQVTQLVRGTAPMYEISSKTGMTYAVNGKHLLHLRHCHPEPRYGTKPGDEIDITVEEAMTKSKTWFNCYYGYQSGYDCGCEECTLDPYILGLWLGDGIRSDAVLAVNKREMAIADAWISYGKDMGLDYTIINGFDGCIKVRLTDHNKGSKNKFMQMLYEHNLYCNKHIPESYFRMSRAQRLRLLAGLIDTDGCYAHNRFEFSNTSRQLIDGVMRLARSLGFHASISEVKSSSVIKGKSYNVAPCWNVGISGEISELNQFTLIKKDTAEKHNKATQSAIRITPAGVEDYYGFVLTGNHLFMLEDGTVTHNCRTRVFENRFGPTTSIGRGNLSFTTVNLPHVALEAKKLSTESGDDLIKVFWDLLRQTCDLVAKQLDARFQWQKTAIAKQYPFLMQKLWNGGSELGPEDSVESVINQGTLGLGFVGLAECLIVLTGKHHGESKESQQLGLNIITSMRDWANSYSMEYGHNYSILATPAEGLAGNALKKDRKMFGVIPGVTDKPFYTNSNHVPVWYHLTPSEKAAIEGPYHELTRGGHIFYVELDGDPSDNPEAIMRIVDLMHKNNIGYGSINYNANTCMDCGHEWTGREKTCPHCGSTNLDTLARITGYLVGSTSRWNSGKKGELDARVAHE